MDHNPKRITKIDIDFAKKLNLKTEYFQSKLETFTKLEKTIPSKSVLSVMKIRKKGQSMYQKNVTKKNMLICYGQEKKERDNIFLSKFLIRF